MVGLIITATKNTSVQVTVRVIVSIDLSVTVTVEGGGQYCLELGIKYASLNKSGRADLLRIFVVDDDGCLITTPRVIITPLEKANPISTNSRMAAGFVLQASLREQGVRKEHTQLWGVHFPLDPFWYP